MVGFPKRRASPEPEPLTPAITIEGYRFTKEQRTDGSDVLRIGTGPTAPTFSLTPVQAMDAWSILEQLRDQWRFASVKTKGALDDVMKTSNADTAQMIFELRNVLGALELDGKAKANEPLVTARIREASDERRLELDEILQQSARTTLPQHAMVGNPDALKEISALRRRKSSAT